MPSPAPPHPRPVSSTSLVPPQKWHSRTGTKQVLRGPECQGLTEEPGAPAPPLSKEGVFHVKWVTQSEVI